MTTSGVLDYDNPPKPSKPRLWVGVFIVIVMWIVAKAPAYLAPQTMIHFMGMMWGPIVGLLAVLIWWFGFSRFPWRTRGIAFIPLVVGPVVAFVAGHKSMQMGMIVAGLPMAITVFVAWAVIGTYIAGGKALRAGLLILPLLVWGFFISLRMDGLDGSIRFSSSWRWSPTKEDRYLEKIRLDPSLAGKHRASAPSTSPVELTLSAEDWPAFRGPNRDGKLVGVSINKDWAQHPPKLLWKHLIGPGWSSFSVIADHAFTQEQRGGSEVVSCYDLNTGDVIWSHDDQTRFDEPMAGPGPRATPTFSDGKLYAMGARGRLNCLNPATGDVIWSRDVAVDSGAEIPMWGFSASPLISNGLVTVITGGKGKTVMAYDALTGQPAWSAGDGWSYASMQLAHLDGVDQLLAVTAAGLFSLDPQHGQILWTHAFSIGSANRAIQPTILNNNDVLLGAAFGIGTRKIHISHTGNTWTNETVWTSKNIKPYYNDMVVHHDNLYGFDGNVFTCIDPATGQSRWRAKGYGNGQVLLIADQNLLLILSETGEAALVDAKPDEFHELAKFQAVNGKTWNHPVIAHGKLLVRNGEEVACYDVK